jgi:hypothetical protein
LLKNQWSQKSAIDTGQLLQKELHLNERLKHIILMLLEIERDEVLMVKAEVIINAICELSRDRPEYLGKRLKIVK